MGQLRELREGLNGMRTRLIGLIAGLAVLSPSLASAQTRVVVLDFKGPNAKQVQGAVETVLEDHDIEVVPAKRAVTTAHRSGADLDSESGRVRVAKKLKLRAFIRGRTKTVKKKIQLELVVLAGSDGMPAGEFNTAQAKSALNKDVQAHLWAAIGGALTGSAAAGGAGPENEFVEETAPAAKPAKGTAKHAAVVAPIEKQPESESAEATPQANDEEAAPEHAEPEEVTTAERPSPLDINLGVRFGTRKFGYNDSLPGLRGYDLGLSPSLGLRAHWYPAAHFTDGVLANIGLDLRGEFMVGVSSKNSSGQKFSTSSHQFGVGLRGRLPLNKLELGLVAGWGQHAFSLENADNVDPGVPDVNYNFIRTAVDAHYQFIPWFSMEARFGYLFCLSLGELGEKAWFPHATGNGVEAEIAAQAGSRKLAGEVSFSVQRYFMSLNPDPADSSVVEDGRVAGGALDVYLSFRLGLIYRM
jgi:hypothetical protein